MRMEQRDDELLDHLADLTGGDVPGFVEVRRLYEADSRLHVPPVIHSYLRAGPRDVRVGEPLAA